jgi:hypothetical protein
VRRSSETLVIERPASGMGKETVLFRANGKFFFPQSWSRDELLLADTSASFYLLPMGPQGSGGERQPIPFPQSPAEGRHPSISPDGRWLLYSSTQTGRREVFVESMPEQMGGPVAGFKRMISNSGGMQPAWRADGKRFLLAQPLEESISVPITVIVNWPELLKKGAGAP